MATLLVSSRVPATEAGPDFTKLANIAPGADLVAAARVRQIPLLGIGPEGEPGQLNPGDSFTGLVTLCEKGGRRTQWLVYLRALASQPAASDGKTHDPLVLYSGRGEKFEFKSAPAQVSLETIGPFALTGSKAEKVQDKTDTFAIDKGFLSLGFERAAAMILRQEQSSVKGSFWFGSEPPDAPQVAKSREFAESLRLTTEDERALAGAFPALLSYFEVVQHTEGLESILLRVVDKPSVWSVVRHLGVKANLEVDTKHFAAAEPKAWKLPGQPPVYYFPLRLELNDQLAVRVTFVVTQPRPPLLSCGGIIGMLAERPGDKETYLTLQIVSARAQTAPAP